MKLNKMLALALSLSTGMALGAAPRAGTAITNQASVDFQVTDPATNATTNGTSSSNIVSTTVAAVPSFTITPNTGEAPLQKTGANAVNAGQATSFTYTVTNTGNTPLTISLQSGDTADLDPTNVGLDQTTLTLAPGAQQNVTQTYTIPATAAGNTFYGRNLLGTALYDSTPSADGTGDSYTETFTGNVDNNNENRTEVFPVPVITPGSPATGPVALPTDPTNTGITPTDSANPNGPGTGNGYVEPTGPGGSTPIQVAPDGSQTAYPKADGDTANDSVTLSGTVPNNSGRTDNLTVGPASDPDAAGPITSQIINPATGNPFVTGEQATDINGNPIPGSTVTVGSNGSVTFNNVPTGTAPAYDIRVTYPDSETAGAPVEPVAVNVPITSSNAGGQALANPTYTVKAPHVQFANADAPLGVSTTPVTKPVAPNTLTDVAVAFPMNVYNDGEYNESYNVVGSVVNQSGSNLSVKYYADTNGNGAFDSGIDTAITTVGPVVTDTETLIFAVVTVPANTPVGTYTINQTITGTTSGIVRNYNEDKVQVGLVTPPVATPGNPTNPLFPVTKAVDKTSAAPGDNVVYTIKGQNKYNALACNVIFKELDGTSTNIFANTTYQTVSGTASTGSLLYSVNQGGSWSATAPATTALTSLWIGVNTNGDTTISTADCLPSQGTVDISLTMQLNK